MRHFVIVGVLVVICTALVYLLLSSAGILPVQASTQAVTIDQMFDIHWALIAFLFSLIMVFLVYSLIVFRQRPGDTSEGKFFKGNTRLEVVWTLIPLATVIALSYIGSQNLAEVRKADASAMEVKVTAFQWGWQFDYPQFGITTSSLYLPVDKQVVLKLTSRDVIHDFWVPEFRVKQDVLPGENLVKELRINPNTIGSYMVRCAYLCGGKHAQMESPVVVVSQGDFDAWAAKEMAATSLSPAERGKKVTDINCKACHSYDGTPGVGPTWKGLYGSMVQLEGGATVTADDAYLNESIVAPAVKIHKGFQNIMPPTFSTTLSSQQIADVIEFIKTLK